MCLQRQLSADCFVDTANRAMPNLSMHFTSVERRFCNNGSNKGVQGFYSKPTTIP